MHVHAKEQLYISLISLSFASSIIAKNNVMLKASQLYLKRSVHKTREFSFLNTCPSASLECLYRGLYF